MNFCYNIFFTHNTTQHNTTQQMIVVKKQRIKYLIPSPPNIDLLNRTANNNLTTYNSEYFIKIFSNWLNFMNYDDEIVTFRMCSRYSSVNNTSKKYHENVLIFETLGTRRFQNNVQYIEKAFNLELPNSGKRKIAIETDMLQNYFYESKLSTQNKHAKSIYDNYHEIIKKYIHKELPLYIQHPDFGNLELTVYCEPFHLYLNESKLRIIDAYSIDPGLHLFLETELKIYNHEFDLEWVTQNSTVILVDDFQKHNYKLVTVSDKKIDINRSFFRKHYFGTTYNYNVVITDKNMQQQYIRDHHLMIDYSSKPIKYYSIKIEHLKYQNGKINKKETIEDITNGYKTWKNKKNIKIVNPYDKANKPNKPNKPKLYYSNNIVKNEEWTILSEYPEPITSSITANITEEDYIIR